MHFLSLNICYSIVAKTTIVTNSFLFLLCILLFSEFALFIMASFPCGKCCLNCESEKIIACNNCDKWFHQKREGLSNIQFSVLRKLLFGIFVQIVVWVFMDCLAGLEIKT